MEAPSNRRHGRRWEFAAVILGCVYGTYRAYYAFGGVAGLPGALRPQAHGTFQWINSVAAAVLLVGAAAPLLMRPLWKSRAALGCVIVCWLAAAGCSMHALLDITQRVLSLSGALSPTYPANLWASVNVRGADLQDLLGSEPWFLLEGFTFAMLALTRLRGRQRLIFIATAVLAIVALFASGMLTSTGHLAPFVVGQQHLANASMRPGL